MHEGYSSRLCLFTALAATYLLHMSNVRWHTVSCRLLKIHSVDFAENVSFGRYDVIFLSQWSMTRLFLDKNKSMVLDTITNGIVHEPLASNDDRI